MERKRERNGRGIERKWKGNGHGLDIERNGKEMERGRLSNRFHTNFISSEPRTAKHKRAISFPCPFHCLSISFSFLSIPISFLVPPFPCNVPVMSFPFPFHLFSFSISFPVPSFSFSFGLQRAWNPAEAGSVMDSVQNCIGPDLPSTNVPFPVHVLLVVDCLCVVDCFC